MDRWIDIEVGTKINRLIDIDSMVLGPSPLQNEYQFDIFIFTWKTYFLPVVHPEIILKDSSRYIFE